MQFQLNIEMLEQRLQLVLLNIFFSFVKHVISVMVTTKNLWK